MEGESANIQERAKSAASSITLERTRRLNRPPLSFSAGGQIGGPWPYGISEQIKWNYTNYLINHGRSIVGRPKW